LLGIDIQSAGYESKTVIRRLSFQLNQPTLLVVIGHNGSGKTTLFRCIASSIAFQGSVTWNNNPIHYGNQPVAYLPQRNTLHFPISVLELIRLAIDPEKNRWFGYTPIENKQAAALASAFGLGDKLMDDMNQLSGGQQQLAWMAQLAARQASVWVLDEPTQSLDLHHKHLIAKNLEQQVHENKRIVIFSTHDIDLLEGFEGLLINLSEMEPKLEKISVQSIERAKSFLKQAPLKK